MELARMRKRGLWNKVILKKVRSKCEDKNRAGMKREYVGIAIWYLDKKLKAR